MWKGQRRAAPSSFPWLSHCIVKVEGKRVWKRKERKRKKLKKPILTTRRRDRIWCDCNSRGNSHKSKVMVLERQSCSPWKATNWRSLIKFLPSPISHNWKTWGRVEQRTPPCYAWQRLVVEKARGDFSLKHHSQNSKQWGMLLDNCWQQSALNPAAKASSPSSLLMYEQATAPALHPSLCKATFAAVCCTWLGLAKGLPPAYTPKADY